MKQFSGHPYSDIEAAVSQVEEVASGGVVAFVPDTGDMKDQLSVALEIKPELVSDQQMFNEYVLPAIDEKLVQLLKDRFQVQLSERIYLESGTLPRSGGGTVDRAAATGILGYPSLNGLIAKRPEKSDAPGEDIPGIKGIVLKLFQEIVEQEPILEEPFLNLGGDSIKILEFLEKLQEMYPLPDSDLLDMIDESTTLIDIIGWLEETD